MNKEQAKQVVENFIRQEVRKNLNESWYKMSQFVADVKKSCKSAAVNNDSAEIYNALIKIAEEYKPESY